MLTAMLRRLGFAHRPNRRRLHLETLEGRDVPAIAYGLTDANTLLRFDTVNPNTTSPIAITGLTAGDELVGIDFRPRTGQLYASGVNGTTVRTYSINLSTGAATVLSTTATAGGIADVATGYDFNPTVDRIRLVNQNNENIRLNPNNGALAGDDTNLTFNAPAAGPIIAEAYDRNFDRQNNAGDTDPLPTTLFGIDRSTSRLVIQGGVNGTPSPNGGVISNIGILGFTLSAVNDGGFDIVGSTDNGGRGTAFAALTANDNVTRLYTINLTTGAASSVGSIGLGTTEILSLAVAPDSALIVGSGLFADVRSLDPATGAVEASLATPFPGFQGGFRVAAGDVTRDGIPDYIVTAVAAGGHVKVFNGVTGTELGSFFAFPGFQGTVNVGSGDVNRDGFDDVLVVANGANGHVKAFSGSNAAELTSFLAYPGFLGNATIAAGDFNNDGTAEIVTTAASNGHVKVLNLTGSLFTSASLPAFANSFFAFGGFQGDGFVTVGDLNGDGTADIAVASGPGSIGHVRAFDGRDNSQLASFFALAVTFGNAPPVQIANVAALAVADVNRDGRYELVLTPSAGRQTRVTAYDLAGNVVVGFDVFANFQGGATVAGQRF